MIMARLSQLPKGVSIGESGGTVGDYITRSPKTATPAGLDAVHGNSVAAPYSTTQAGAGRPRANHRGGARETLDFIEAPRKVCDA